MIFTTSYDQYACKAIILPDICRFAMSESSFLAFSLSKEKMLAQIIRYRGNILSTINIPDGNK